MSSTVFESLFPLLALQSCISAGRGSSNGPRFSAVDRATKERFEVRVVVCQPESSNVEACKARAETLLAARSSNRAVMLPEDVYVAEGRTHAPQGGTQMVCVSKRCGASLADLMHPLRHKTEVESTGNDLTPTMLSEISFFKLLDAVNKFVSIHLTLPIHGNIGLNALVLGSADLADNECDWAVTDWALDPMVVEHEARRLMVPPLEKSRRTQKQWLKVLRTAFLRPSGLSNRYVVGISSPLGCRQHASKGSVAVVRRNGSLWSNSELERRIIEAVCPRGSTQAAVETNLLAATPPMTLDAGASDDEETICSLEERAQEHQVMLAQERLDAMRDASAKAVLSGGSPDSSSGSDPVDPSNKPRSSQPLNLDVGLPTKRRPSPKRSVPDFTVENEADRPPLVMTQATPPSPPARPPRVLAPPPQLRSGNLRTPITQMFSAVERSTVHHPTPAPPIPSSAPAPPIPSMGPPIPSVPREQSTPVERSLVPESEPVAAGGTATAPRPRMIPPPPPDRPTKHTSGSKTSCSARCCSLM